MDPNEKRIGETSYLEAMGSLPFEEQIKFFLGKLNLPTKRWDDITKSAHDWAFVVAGATKAELLSDLRAAVTKGIQDGTSLDQFRIDFDKIVRAHGWTNWTGAGSKEGVAWRTKVIYETNLYSSYAAGRYAQLQEVKKERPFWRYRHNDNVKTPRPLHVSWDGLIIHADDPWWKEHFPPGGYGCKCFVESLAPRDMKKLGKTGPDKAPDNGTYDWMNPDGTVREAGIPQGIDPGFNYTPGESQAGVASKSSCPVF
ncbi:hypothetical protein CCP4SC76_2180002 [Gammaproteobacteria bacterium]